VDQVDFADVLLLNKTDLVSAPEAERLVATLRRFNPAADVVTGSFAEGATGTGVRDCLGDTTGPDPFPAWGPIHGH
jgi:G3E family GTPase